MREYTSGEATGGVVERIFDSGALRECLFHCGVDRQELGEARDLDHRMALLRQSRQGKCLRLVSPVNKDLDQRSHTGGVEKRYAPQIKNEMRRGLRPQGLDKIVNGLEAEFATEPHHSLITGGIWLFFQV